VFVAASTDCFPKLPIPEALARLVDLEFTAVELVLREGAGLFAPSRVHANLEQSLHACRSTHRMTPAALVVDIAGEGRPYYDQFASCCKLAKALKVVSITVPAAELGAPFNGEVERLQELVRIATLEGVVVGLKTEIGRISQDPSTAAVLCDHVKGLAITLDPSAFVFGPHGGASYDQVLKFVGHVQLRDTSKKKFQARVGQGEIEYTRLVTQLAKFKYSRALCVYIADDLDSDVEHTGEMRKLRLLLESLL
jgi:sugar phosphate isomerase/epimerase